TTPTPPALPPLATGRTARFSSPERLPIAPCKLSIMTYAKGCCRRRFDRRRARLLRRSCGRLLRDACPPGPGEELLLLPHRRQDGRPSARHARTCDGRGKVRPGDRSG